MHSELLYQLALTQIPQIGCVQARLLLERFGTASAIFKAPLHILEKTEGIGTVRAQHIKSFQHFKEAEQEITFMEKFKIEPLFLNDKNYPQRLLNCYDPPTLLYYRGHAPLNHPKIVAIIGTRTHTDYGKQQAEKIISTLAQHQVLVVSGLAFGIDAVAHKSALKNSVPTVGVLAHGLDLIYPLQHTNMAKEMVKQGGGLLTEFRSNTKPDKHHFPTRNRIVAGMSDAVIVIESGARGGSMVTAELANGYNRDVFACPGRSTDPKSAGCNYLIRNNKAILLTDPAELVQVMGWEDNKKSTHKKQRELFVQLSDDEKIVVELLQASQQTSIDELNLKSGMSSSRVAAAILNLELQNLVQSLPGKMYTLC